MAEAPLDVEFLAKLLDSQFRIPGTGWRVGLDALIGLLPGVGDGATAVLSLYIVMRARRLGAPTTILLKMIGNVGVDLVVGSIPVFGDIFDVAWKANRRNLHLLKCHLSDVGAEFGDGKARPPDIS